MWYSHPWNHFTAPCQGQNKIRPSNKLVEGFHKLTPFSSLFRSGLCRFLPLWNGFFSPWNSCPLSFCSWFLVTYTRLCLLPGYFLTSCLCLDYWLFLSALSIGPYSFTQSHKQICYCWLISGKALAPSLFYALVILCCQCSFFHGFLMKCRL